MEENIKKVNIEDKVLECHKQFSNYSIKRAIPQLNDGLKMVQRRIIYAMYKDKMFYGNEFFKSVRVVGSVIGKYHPHGDAAVYGTIVKLCQTFNNNMPLILSQGNFGSIDGDPAAAPRYTEVKLSMLSEYLYKHIEHETVTWSENFDSTLLEPDSLTGELPFALINGVFGIAVGVMSSVLPHNLTELLDGCIAGLDNENLTSADFLQYIKGPDLPTNCELSDKDILEVYTTGRGTIDCRGIIDIENNYLVIKGIPFNTLTSKIFQEIHHLRKNKISEISNVIDESSMEEGMRIVINTKDGENLDLIRNKLFKYTSLNKKLYTNMLFIWKDKVIQTNLSEYIYKFLENKSDLTKKRISYFLKQAINEEHRNKLLLWCQKHTYELIDIIKNNNNLDINNELLKLKSDLSQEDISYILNISLKTLGRAEQSIIEEKLEKISSQIKNYNEILNSEKVLKNFIKDEFNEIKNKFVCPRKTKIYDFEQLNLIKNYDVFAILYQGRYLIKQDTDILKIKRLTNKTNNFKTSFGVPTIIKKINNNQDGVYFSNDGCVFKYSTNNIPTLSEAQNNYLNMLDTQKWFKPKTVVNDILLLDDILAKKYIITISSNGIVSKYNSEIISKLRNGSKLFNNNNLIQVLSANENDKIILVTEQGFGNCFSVSEIRKTNKGSKGVIGIKLRTKDKVIGGIIHDEDTIPYIFTTLGFGKGLNAVINQTHKGTKGVINIKLRIGDKVSGIRNLSKTDNLIMITQVGDMFQTTTENINIQITKHGKGQKIVNLEKNSKIIKVI